MDTPQRKQTLVNEGTEFRGEMKSQGDVLVQGTLSGALEAPEIQVARTGVVLGKLQATKLRSEGTVAGEIDADDVFLAGSVGSETRIRTHRLEMKLNSEEGKLELTFAGTDSDTPNVQPRPSSPPMSSVDAATEKDEAP